MFFHQYFLATRVDVLWNESAWNDRENQKSIKLERENSGGPVDFFVLWDEWVRYALWIQNKKLKVVVPAWAAVKYSQLNLKKLIKFTFPILHITAYNYNMKNVHKHSRPLPWSLNCGGKRALLIIVEAAAWWDVFQQIIKNLNEFNPFCNQVVGKLCCAYFPDALYEPLKYSRKSIERHLARCYRQFNTFGVCTSLPQWQHQYRYFMSFMGKMLMVGDLLHPERTCLHS